MLILVMLVIGLAAGWLAQVILTRGAIDWTLALVTGVIGSFVGGLLISLLAGDGIQIRPSGIVGSVVGAVLVLAAYRAARGTS